MSPRAQQALRQPSFRMIVCSHGRIRIAPTPTPENASPIASARRRTNQFGRYCDCTEKLMQFAPAPTRTPSVA